MGPVDIVVLILALFIVGGVVGNYFYRKRNKMAVGECSYCALKSENMLKKIRKELKKDKKGRG